MVARSRWSVSALTAVVSLGLVIFYSLYSLVPLTYADTPSLSSLYVGTMMTFVMAVQVFTPLFVRRFSLRTVLACSLSLLAAGAAATGFSTTLAPLLIGAVASGAGFGVLIVAGSQGVALLVAAPKLGRALGTYGLITMAATALGSPLGVHVALTFSPTAFGVSAAFAALIGIGASFGVPRGVGLHDTGLPSALASTQQRKLQELFSSIPWQVMVLLLIAVVMLSHGLSSLPVSAAAFGGAAVVVFAVQIGNALGRALGGECEARLGTNATIIVGVLLLAAGGTLGVFVQDASITMVSAVLLGAGVGIVQTVALHTAMQRMTPGRASVVWNLSVDAGLWVGGILWGLALTGGFVVAGVWLVSSAAVIAGVGVVLQLRNNGARLAR
jgi:predicted MFS family arabinose efflux permease